jgi:hypothetical protein
MTTALKNDEFWTSNYLSRGFGQDVINIQELINENNGISARFTVNCGEDGPKPFHLSTISAHRAVAQLGINFICSRLRASKSDIGEVWELSYSGSYEKPILHDVGIPISLVLLSRTQRRRIESWLFRFDVGNGAFKGTIALAPDKLPFQTNGKILSSAKPLHTYQDFYYSFYGVQKGAAEHSKAVYRPKACLAFKPTRSLVAEIRELAATMSICLQKIFESYHRGVTLGFTSSVSNRLALSKRSKCPSLIRLDVIETRDGPKIVEVNAGNCGGAETYFRMQQFLRKDFFPNSREMPFLLECFLDRIMIAKPGRVVFTYLEDQSQYLSLARKQIYRQFAPDTRVDVLPLHALLDELNTGARIDFIYRDFVYEELASAGAIGQEAENLFISDVECPPYFPSFSDEILSDKAFIGEVDCRIRQGSGDEVGLTETDCRHWQRWLAPCTTSARILHHGGEPDFHMPDGVVIKPADGYGGDRVFIFPVCSLPMNRSFYGQTSWVVQRFFESPTYSVERANSAIPDHVHLVHGVFLMPHDGILRYAGTFTRLSPDLVVNIKNDGDVVLFCEPEWFV